MLTKEQHIAKLSLEHRGYNPTQMAEFVYHLTPDVEFFALGDRDEPGDGAAEYGSFTLEQLKLALANVPMDDCDICGENHGIKKADAPALHCEECSQVDCSRGPADA